MALIGPGVYHYHKKKLWSKQQSLTDTFSNVFKYHWTKFTILGLVQMTHHFLLCHCYSVEKRFLARLFFDASLSYTDKPQGETFLDPFFGKIFLNFEGFWPWFGSRFWEDFVRWIFHCAVVALLVFSPDLSWAILHHPLNVCLQGSFVILLSWYPLPLQCTNMALAKEP